MYTLIPRDRFVSDSETGGASQDRFSHKHSVAMGRVVPEHGKKKKNIYIHT
jgi:hypothetical protein